MLKKPDPDQSEAAVRCLRTLAKLDPDGASRRNNVGFNGSDSARGHQLARLPLTNEHHYGEARRMIWTYRRQLDPTDINIVYRDYQTPSPIDLDALVYDESMTDSIVEDDIQIAARNIALHRQNCSGSTVNGLCPECGVMTDSNADNYGLIHTDQINPYTKMMKNLQSKPTPVPPSYDIDASGGFDDLNEPEEFCEKQAQLAVRSDRPSTNNINALDQAPPVEGSIELTPEQHAAVDKIVDWLVNPNGPQEFKLGGYAGTGKTTLIKRLLQILNAANKTYAPSEISFLRGKKPMVAAFTGKACNVLRRKGVPANTIHSTMYRPVEVDRKTHEIEWRRIPHWELTGNFWIIDEASMISTDIYNDMKQYGMKMLFVGDPGQLEPVGENPNLMRTPDVTLQTIHRQALQSPIIKLATDIRHGFPLPPMGQVHPDLLVRDKVLNSTDLLSVSQVICAKNKTRTQINNVCRQALGRTAALEVTDKLIITKNNKDMGVFNGMIIIVDKIRTEDHRRWVIDAMDEDGQPIFGLPIAKEPFSVTYDAKTARITKDLVQADYGYCITCHKSQGSEWPHVMVIDEWVPPHVWDMKRWRYTAFTRAAKKLTVCRDEKKPSK